MVEEDRRLVEMVLLGRTYGSIARALCIDSERKVAKRIWRIAHRNALFGRVDLILWYVEHHMSPAKRDQLRNMTLVLDERTDPRRLLDQRALLEWAVSPLGRTQTMSKWAKHFLVSEATIMNAFREIAKRSKIPRSPYLAIAIYFLQQAGVQAEHQVLAA